MFSKIKKVKETSFFCERERGVYLKMNIVNVLDGTHGLQHIFGESSPILEHAKLCVFPLDICLH